CRASVARGCSLHNDCPAAGDAGRSPAPTPSSPISSGRADRRACSRSAA
ncbi:MAG: hypothetical protein AVDCRST_MAG04-1153, partial [uncultured Acetobacteraceae bacterium]